MSIFNKFLKHLIDFLALYERTPNPVNDLITMSSPNFHLEYLSFLIDKRIHIIIIGSLY